MGPKFETVPAAGPTPPPGGWDPGVTPNTTGLPGIPQAQALAGGIITYVLIGLVVAMIISALVWAFSAWKGHQGGVQGGKMSLIVCFAAAIIVGAADAIIVFAAGVGQQVK